MNQPPTKSNKSNKVLLSFDVEEFDIPEEYGHHVDLPTQLEVSAHGLVKVLDLLDELEVSATFFVTAFFGQSKPALLQRIATRHEVASHGFYHSRFTEEDLITSRTTLESLTQLPVLGFRRPRFAPTRKEAIANAGYHYNSSENPIWLPGRYQNFFRSRLPYREANIWQIPISASPLVRFPFFWLSFKNLPLPLFQLMSAWTLHHDGFLNLIFHPWEFCDLRPYSLPSYVRKIDSDALLNRLKTYLQSLPDSVELVTFTSFIHDHLPQPRH